MPVKLKLKIAIYFIIFLFFPSNSEIFSQDTSAAEQKLRLVADAVLKDASFQFVDQEGNIFESTEEAPEGSNLYLKSAYNDWRYWNGVLNIAMIKIGKVLNEKKYTGFAVKNVAFNFNNYKYFEEKHRGENKWSYPFGQKFILEELDDGGAMGAGVIEVYKMDKQQKYLEYINEVANHMMNKQSRLNDGTFVRGFPHEWTLWADDLYMGLSFISRMGVLTGEEKYFDDAAEQVINFHKYLFDEEKGLMTHCWYSDLKQRNAAYWGRANGWAAVAQVDLLDNLPENHPQKDTLISLLQRHVLGLSKYQGPEGLWHQLLDKADSYYETSCTAMFTYAVARAVNKGYIDKRYSSIAERGWEGVMTKINSKGEVEGVCTGTVVSNDLVYYYKRPAPLNDVHGLGTIILAGAEVLKLKK